MADYNEFAGETYAEKLRRSLKPRQYTVSHRFGEAHTVICDLCSCVVVDPDIHDNGCFLRVEKARLEAWAHSSGQR